MLLLIGLCSPVWVPLAFFGHRLIMATKEKRWQFGLLWLLLFTTAEGIALFVAFECYRVIDSLSRFTGPSD